VPVVAVARTALKPELDGVLDDEIWQAATVATNFSIVANWRKPLTTAALPVSRDSARLAWDGETLYIGITIDQPNMEKLVLHQNFPSPGVCTDDSIEVMVDPRHRRDKADYVQIQLNAAGVMWHQWTRYGWCKPVPVDLGLRSSTAKADDRWTAELAIPLAVLADGKLPASGDEWGLNLYCNKRAGGGSSAWSRTFGNWHVIDRFGIVKFE